MNEQQIMEFKGKISVSTARDMVKHYLYKACNLRLAQINNTEQLMAVHGDMSDFN